MPAVGLFPLLVAALLVGFAHSALVSNVASATPPEEAAHFVILGMPRTGSNWLVNMMGQVPSLVCHAEALGLEFYMDETVRDLWPEEPEGGDQDLQQWRREHLGTFLPEVHS
jgi:hypothetical protein